MSADSGNEPVDDEELLYRRVPVSMGWYSNGGLSPEAFDPRKDEATGISVYRAKYRRIEQAAEGRGRKGYFVAVLRAGDLRQHGIEIVPRPGVGDPGHAELPNLTCHNRTEPATQEYKVVLAKLTLRVEGPFPGQPS